MKFQSGRRRFEEFGMSGSLESESGRRRFEDVRRWASESPTTSFPDESVYSGEKESSSLKMLVSLVDLESTVGMSESLESESGRRRFEEEEGGRNFIIHYETFLFFATKSF